MPKNSLGKLKTNLVWSAVVSTLSLTSASALAQENTNNNEETVEKIEVTGSRILREGAIAPSPVTVISGEDLLKTGAISIGEALNDLPALANTFSLANAGNSIGTAGLNLLDLRGMGTDRTLVLVDGKRHVSSSPGTGSVDTNTIPTAWVERVEIITGGASAVYGADAVTGVVNFVLKKDIEGLTFNATKSYAEEGPYDNDKVTISFGQNFDNDRGNFGLSVSHYRQDGMNAADREQTRTPTASGLSNPADGDTDGIHDGIPDRLWLKDAAWYDDSTAGNFYTYDANGAHWYIFNPDGSVRQQQLGTTYNWGRCSGECDMLDLNKYTELQPTFKTLNINAKANYDITDEINLYGEAKFVRTKADSIGQPSFFEYGSGFTIQRDNAFIHESLATLMDNEGLDSINLHRFMEDVGRRAEVNVRETKRFVVGVDGSIGDDWNFDIYGVHGETTREQTNRANVITERLRQSVDAVVLDDGSIGCRSEAARADGCIPTTLFGANNVDQLAADWFSTTSISNSKVQQTVFAANFNNSALFDVPAGPVGFATGVEYRKEKSDDIPDPFAATGATFFTALQEEHGEFDVKEAFAEMSVPVISDVFLIQDLTFDAALRFADYSTIGSATSWKVGADWAVNDQLRFRATASEAIRAPNISELFGPLQQSFGQVNDPCQEGRPQDPVTIANCAALGIPTDFQALATVASIELEVGGNPDLKEEESTSFTFGLVYQPEFIENFVVTVDYWSIEIEDAIDQVDEQDILDKCVQSVGGIDNQFCALVTRDADHEIRLVRTITQNVAKQKAQGIDFEVGYDFDTLGGAWSTQFIATYLKTRKEFPFQIEPTQFIENAGTTGEAEWQANLLVGYTRDKWSANWRTRYLEDVSRFTPQELELNPDRSNIMGYPSYVISDIRAGYSFENGVTIEFGIDNVFDKDLPNFTTGTGVGTASYDNIGRLYYTSLTYKM
ncbi:TonB-dependent receptor plug domain-containing protein [Flocculibacter collagenilyticus]|uniref:TonB-dependent receptor plug domain-containing protein n=1 Tax=Flocculibacter collagenilyticus TaxID=2744479 RepID=UPI0018F5408A|nr:TonB-dependent receptor [Flocculibacter collagenilyticus]